MSGATSQRALPEASPVVRGGTVTASPGPWHSRGGTASARVEPHSSQASREGSRWAVPGAVNSSTRPRNTATGPEPGPSSHSRSSMRRPKTAGALTTSKAVPQGRTTGASGRSSHRARVLRGYVLAEAIQAMPSPVARVTFGVLLMADRCTGRDRADSLGCRKSGHRGWRGSILPARHMPSGSPKGTTRGRYTGSGDVRPSLSPRIRSRPNSTIFFA
ncbi:hypothetical protein AMK32_34820 [Streptomyces sp. CB01883]|nr:hypothetical protein AMK32_34820 [Streptomyces sp. CB01883]